MLENVSVFDHDVKAVIQNLTVLVSVDEVPDSIAVKRVCVAVLYDLGGFGILEVSAEKIESTRHYSTAK